MTSEIGDRSTQVEHILCRTDQLTEIRRSSVMVGQVVRKMKMREDYAGEEDEEDRAEDEEVEGETGRVVFREEMKQVSGGQETLRTGQLQLK